MLQGVNLGVRGPAGEYTVITGRGKKVTRFGRSVLELPCVVLEGEFKSRELLHYLNLPRRSFQKRGRARVKARSLLAKALLVATDRVPQPREPIPLSVLEHKMFKARVEVPERDSRNRPVPPALRHPTADGHVAELRPDAVHLGQYRLVGLLDVDRICGGHPALMVRDPTISPRLGCHDGNLRVVGSHVGNVEGVAGHLEQFPHWLSRPSHTLPSPRLDLPYLTASHLPETIPVGSAAGT
jgi:hypothetical protein